MGFFSWLTSDTGRSIANQHSIRETFPVYMVTDDGQIFTELNYDGYGVFGGKDIFVLIAEMNGYKGETDEETRQLAFDKIWVRGITKGGKRYCYGEDFDNYQSPIESEGGLCANDLIKDHGWKSFGDSGDFNDWADLGIRVPKLVEELPLNLNHWREWWELLAYPIDCADQGFFYDDEDEDYEEEYEDYEEED